MKISPYLAWLSAAAFVFFQFFLQSSSAIMSEHWVHDFDLDEVELSNLSAAFFYSYIPMQIIAGILYDKFNEKIILLSSAIVLSLGCLTLGLVENYQLAIIARFFMGLGAASGFVGLLKIIQNNFTRDRFALMFGIAEAIGMIGVALGLIVLAAFLESFTWRSAMMVCGILAALLGGFIGLFVQKKKNQIEHFSFLELIAQIKSVVTNKQVILCSIYGFFIISIMTCFTSLWGEPFLDTTYHFDPQTISLLLSTVFIGVAVGSPCNGWFVKLYGKHKELMLWESGLAFLLSMMIILIPIPLPGLFVLFFLIGFFCSSAGPCYALVNDAVKNEVQATALAFSNMVIISSAPVLQLIIGKLLNSHAFGYAPTVLLNYRIALTILPLSYFIAFLTGFFIQPSKFRSTQESLN